MDIKVTYCIIVCVISLYWTLIIMPNLKVMIVFLPEFCINLYFRFFLFVFDLLFNLFTIALWPSVGKELSPWLFTCAVFILVPS